MRRSKKCGRQGFQAKSGTVGAGLVGINLARELSAVGENPGRAYEAS